MAHEEQQSRRKESNFRGGLQQLKHDYFGGQKTRPANYVTSRQSAACKCSHKEISDIKYHSEQDDAYQYNASKNDVHGYVSDDDDFRGYSKVSESAFKGHGAPDSPRHAGYYKASEYLAKYDESHEYPRKGYQMASDYDYSKVSQSRYMVNSAGAGVRRPAISAYGRGRVHEEDYVEEKYRRKAQASPPYAGREKMPNVQVDMGEKRHDIRKSQNGYYASDAEYASQVHKTGYKPQKYITEEEVYGRNIEQSYESSGSKYLRPEFWKQEIATATEHFSEKKQSLKSKRDDYASLKIDISGKLKL